MISNKSKRGIFFTLLMFCALIVKMIANIGIDSDTWFILNNGRYIVNNGFPIINPFVFHENFPIILSQPLTSVLEYVIYQLFHYAGLYFWVVFWVLCSVYAIYLLGTNIHSYCNVSTTKFVSIVAAFMVSFCSLCNFWTNRPQLLTISILTLTLTCIENFLSDSKKSKRIWLLPLFSFLLANLHGSFYVVVYLPLLAYFGSFVIEIIACRFMPKISYLSHCKKICKPTMLIPVVLIMIVAGFVNPYGLSGNLYLFQSVKTATTAGMVQELSAPLLASSMTVVYLVEVTIGLIWIVIAWKHHSCNTYHVLLWLGGNLTYLMAIRNLLLATIFALPLLFDAILSCNLEKLWSLFAKLNEKLSWHIITIFLCVLSVYTAYSTYQECWTVTDTHTTPIEAVTYLNAHVDNKNCIKIYTGFNNGAFLEWYEYKVYMDARPELFQQGNVYEEYVQIHRSLAEPEDFIDKYDFDYLVVYDDKDSNAEALLRYYLKNCPTYQLVVTGNNYKMYAKK